jgi:ribose transport system substrate-binding protein
VIDPNKTYVPGVPTMHELLTKGTESPPPTSGPSITKNASLVFVSCGQEAPGCRTPAEAAGRVAKALGWKFTLINGSGNVNNGWANGIRSAIAIKPSAIALIGENCPEEEQPLREAKAAKIGVIALEGMDCNSKLYGGTAEPLFTIPMMYSESEPTGEAYFQQWGTLQADYAIDATEGAPKVIQTIYQGGQGTVEEKAQDAVYSKCSGCKVVLKLPWTVTEEVPSGPLVHKFDTALVQYPEANVTLLNFDSACLEGELCKAVVDAGRAKSMAMGGGEGVSPEVQALIRGEKGYTFGVGGEDEQWLGWATIDEVNRYLHKESSVTQGVGFHPVNKTNLPAAGQAYKSPINWRAAYEKIWGVKLHVAE